MKLALQESEWDAACLLAIHCAISSADALTVHFQGLRSKSQRHQDAAQLVKKIPKPDAGEKTRLFLFVLDRKNLVEYEETLMSENKARTIVEQAERFYQWAKAQLPT